MSLLQDSYYSHRPKEKLHSDSNNNENSVPKDFDSIDSNSNLGPRSHSKHKLDKVQDMLGKSANEVLKYPLVQLKGTGHGHNKSHERKTYPPNPTVPSPTKRVQLGTKDGRREFNVAQSGSETKKEQPQCEISGKEAISALSRAKTRECRQQIVELYCKHKDRALMPERVPRYCPVDGKPRTL